MAQNTFEFVSKDPYTPRVEFHSTQAKMIRGGCKSLFEQVTQLTDDKLVELKLHYEEYHQKLIGGVK